MWRRRFAAFQWLRLLRATIPKSSSAYSQKSKASHCRCYCHGEPNACGRGSTEWITGEGRFDKGAAQRFREFFSAIFAKRDPLPIFFNSDGGLVSEAVQIG